MVESIFTVKQLKSRSDLEAFSSTCNDLDKYEFEIIGNPPKVVFGAISNLKIIGLVNLVSYEDKNGKLDFSIKEIWVDCLFNRQVVLPELYCTCIKWIFMQGNLSGDVYFEV